MHCLLLWSLFDFAINKNIHRTSKLTKLNDKTRGQEDRANCTRVKFLVVKCFVEFFNHWLNVMWYLFIAPGSITSLEWPNNYKNSTKYWDWLFLFCWKCFVAKSSTLFTIISWSLQHLRQFFWSIQNATFNFSLRANNYISCLEIGIYLFELFILKNIQKRFLSNPLYLY